MWANVIYVPPASDSKITVMQQSAPSLIDILVSTLKQLKENAELGRDDPAVRELERHILQTIAELEVQKNRAA